MPEGALPNFGLDSDEIWRKRPDFVASVEDCQERLSALSDDELIYELESLMDSNKAVSSPSEDRWFDETLVQRELCVHERIARVVGKATVAEEQLSGDFNG